MLDISLEQIHAVLGIATVIAPKGTLDGPRKSIAVESTEQITHVAAFDNLIIAWRNGAPLRVPAMPSTGLKTSIPLPDTGGRENDAYAQP